MLSGDRGVTYAATPPAGTVITEGDWWPADYAGPPLMSFAAEEGREMGLKLGDALTVNILGRDLTATIASFRKVEFETMGINFLILIDPAALAGAPHTHIATVYATPEAEAPLAARDRRRLSQHHRDRRARGDRPGRGLARRHQRRHPLGRGGDADSPASWCWSAPPPPASGGASTRRRC